ncbi:TPA: 50S ribosomal protein L15 [Candidatus Uhrbacteria bacterium]|uniref:Large ribosomal subunit protein uL15 n=2 Tax=Candidatus Uhriibacteriota TaxID=1752732 RepID=A0A0G1T736_9BACT|nr:MAG: 50S ribosomal protein L15 [Candidatus Uhrbacteria bacterium GW2011_GWF2_46_218]KKU41200.1 MAG: 50S ribosomal protein L15 [Candidatus Uhrbacteria bacterium GW2011_GWE2_46_68]HBK34048.1 50S ribosomal protein L15 [Candidatus Uhrbacteria bacterium]HCB18874.1 50S ribosomal protein L15 [Candidatus Uhrbacteria bacterium]
MALSLHTLHPKNGSRKSSVRIGRGLSKKGTYSGRGAKGQRSRSGGKSGLRLKGLRVVMLGTPKQRGFTSLAQPFQVVNVGSLSKVFIEGQMVTPRTLKEKQLISSPSRPVKILGKGEITIKVIVKECRFSAEAKAKIEKAGGTVTP